MKRKILPLIIAAATAGAFSTTAAADVTVYGKANLSLNSTDTEKTSDGVSVAQDDDTWELNSNASRLGVKGSQKITDNLKVIYKYEFEVFIDDGDSGSDDTFKQRNIYAGLQGNFGTLIAGKHDTPTKLAQGKIDRFNDLELGDIKNVMVGENREDNIIMYTTPKFNNISLTAATILQEDEDGSGEDDGLADSISASLNYKTKNLYLALSVDDDLNNTDIVRVVGEYNFGIAKIGALYQTAEENESGEGISSVKGPAKDFNSIVNIEEQDAWLISGEVKVADGLKLKAQYGYSESTHDIATSPDTEVTQIAVGADYKLSKKAKLFAYYSQLDVENDLLDAEPEDNTFGVGYEIKF